MRLKNIGLRNLTEIDELLEKANNIYSNKDQPVGNSGCKDCERLEDLITLVQGS
jgi:hypothetical protein